MANGKKVIRMTDTGRSQQSVTKEQMTELVRKKAQEIYEKSGRKAGRDLDNWLEAERIVKQQYKIG